MEFLSLMQSDNDEVSHKLVGLKGEFFNPTSMISCLPVFLGRIYICSEQRELLTVSVSSHFFMDENRSMQGFKALTKSILLSVRKGYSRSSWYNKV